MIITVLWEDQRGGRVKGFGPHDLLIACLEDNGFGPRSELGKQVISQAQNGNGGVRPPRRTIAR